MLPPVAFFDASVLYSMAITDLAIEMALAGLFQMHWSEEVHREWMYALSQHRPDLANEKIERRCQNMNCALPGALVKGYAHRIPEYTLPDPNDRHVLAAAVECGAEVIVTFNLGDFPDNTLAPLGVEPLPPDLFLAGCVDQAPQLALDCAKNILARLKRPPLGFDVYLEKMRTNELVQTAEMLKQIKSNRPQITRGRLYPNYQVMDSGLSVLRHSSEAVHFPYRDFVVIFHSCIGGDVCDVLFDFSDKGII